MFRQNIQKLLVVVVFVALFLPTATVSAEPDFGCTFNYDPVGYRIGSDRKAVYFRCQNPDTNERTDAILGQYISERTFDGRVVCVDGESPDATVTDSYGANQIRAACDSDVARYWDGDEIIVLVEIEDDDPVDDPGDNPGDEPGSSVGPVGDDFDITPPEFTNDNNPIFVRLQQVINFLTIGIGIVITGSVIVAGIQWAASRGDPQAAGAAVRRLVSAGTALILFVVGWALINWLIPGGPLN